MAARHMRLLFLTQYNETGASSRLAIYTFLPFFERAGFQTTVRPLMERDAYQVLGPLATTRKMLPYAWIMLRIACLFPRRLFHLLDAWQFDAVVVQKDVLPFGLSWVLRRLQSNIIYEFDDPIWLSHPASGQNVKWLGEWVARYRKHCLIQVIRRSRLVVADNPKLKEFAQRYNANTVWLKTAIAPSDVVPGAKNPKEPLGFGWVGSPSSSYLLENLVPALEQLAKSESFVLYNIGGLPISTANFETVNVPWSEENEKAYLEKTDIGLMPADENPFNRLRFSRRWFIYSKVGIPTLASTSGLNEEAVVPDVTGLLYRLHDASDFIRQAKRLIQSPELRKKLGNAARQVIEQEHALPRVAETFVKLVQEASQ